VDDAVGTVLMELRALELGENTIVVFTSDNGGVASGDAYATCNAPLRGGKGYQWEGGIRVPYFMKVPWMDIAEGSTAYPVSGIDFYPTILELLNVGIPSEHKVDGQSLKPLLEGHTMDDRPLFWHYPHYGNQGGEPSSIIRLGKWKLIHYWEDGRDELYDLNLDPGEQANVLAEFPIVCRDLRGSLDAWLRACNAVLPVADDTYDEVLADERQQRIIREWWPQQEQRRKEMLSSDYRPDKDWWGSERVGD
jgi:arylsulfatase A-like enzyme